MPRNKETQTTAAFRKLRAKERAERDVEQSEVVAARKKRGEHMSDAGERKLKHCNPATCQNGTWADRSKEQRPVGERRANVGMSDVDKVSNKMTKRWGKKMRKRIEDAVARHRRYPWFAPWRALKEDPDLDCPVLAPVKMVDGIKVRYNGTFAIHGEGQQRKLLKLKRDDPDTWLEVVLGEICGMVDHKTGEICRAKPCAKSRQTRDAPYWPCRKHYRDVGETRQTTISARTKEGYEERVGALSAGRAYARCFNEEELSLVRDLDVDSVEAEIMVMKLRLVRTMQAENRQREALESNDKAMRASVLQLQEVKSEAGSDGIARRTTVRRVIDYQTHINHIITQIVKLTHLQYTLNGNSSGELSPAERATMAREALKEATHLMGVLPDDDDTPDDVPDPDKAQDAD